METTEVLKDWLVRAKRKARAHRISASYYEARHMWMWIPSIILSAISGTAVVSQQTAKDPSEWKWWIVVMIALAAILSSLQTVLNFGARAKQHQAKAAGFATHRTRLQSAIDGLIVVDSNEIQRLMAVGEELGREEPTIPPSIWKDVESKYPRN